MIGARLVACLVVLAACKSEQPGPDPAKGPAAVAPAPALTPPPVIDQAALLAGTLPNADPTTDVVNAQCRICHAIEYLTQQRLSEAGWKKTIDKMRTFGANLTDEQVSGIVAYAGRYWNPDLPQRTWTLVAPPAGALPIAPAPPSPAPTSP